MSNSGNKTLFGSLAIPLLGGVMGLGIGRLFDNILSNIYQNEDEKIIKENKEIFLQYYYDNLIQGTPA